MAIGRTFKEPSRKAFVAGNRKHGLGADERTNFIFTTGAGRIDTARLSRGSPEETLCPNAKGFLHPVCFTVGYEHRRNHELTRIDPWFLFNIREIIDLEKEIRSYGSKVTELELWKKIRTANPSTFRSPAQGAKEFGFSDNQLGHLLGSTKALSVA